MTYAEHTTGDGRTATDGLGQVVDIAGVSALIPLIENQCHGRKNRLFSRGASRKPRCRYLWGEGPRNNQNLKTGPGRRKKLIKITGVGGALP